MRFTGIRHAEIQGFARPSYEAPVASPYGGVKRDGVNAVQVRKHANVANAHPKDILHPKKERRTRGKSFGEREPRQNVRLSI